MCGRVAPTRIVLANGLRRHYHRTGQRIDEARLADARTAQQSGRLSDCKAVAKRFKSLAGYH